VLNQSTDKALAVPHCGNDLGLLGSAWGRGGGRGGEGGQNDRLEVTSGRPLSLLAGSKGSW
jgi:hypothetical protein